MTKPLTSSSVANVLAECYKNAGHWGSRRAILSIRDGPLEKLWSYLAQVKNRKAPSDPSWPRFCFGNCLISNVLTKNVNVCFNSRKVAFNSEITHVQARIIHPRAANNWKFYL